MAVLYSGGDSGYLAWSDESDPVAASGTPGTWVTPTEFVMAESIALDDKPNMIARDVYAGPGRDTDVGYRTGKSVVGGSVGLALYPKNGQLALRKAIGKNVSISALSADTATSFTVANGVATAVLSAGGAYNPNDIVFVDTSGTALYEPLPVISYVSGSKTLTFPAPRFTHATSSVAIHRLAHNQYQPITASDAVGDVLGTLSVEEGIGTKYSQRYPGMYVDSYSLKATAAKMDVTLALVSMARRVLANGQGSNPSPTAFSESGSWGELGFEFAPDSFLVFPADPTDSGTATVQVVADVTDWSVDVKNNFKAESTTDRSTAMRQFPKKREVDIGFSMLNAAARPVGWTDFLTQNKDVAWFAFCSLNIGTPSVPVWVAASFYCPSVRYQSAQEVRGLTDTIGETITAKARGINGAAKILVSVFAA